MGTAELLHLWETGLNRTTLERSLILLAAARPDLSPAEAAGLSIGARDAELLRLRQHLFGTHLVSTSTCPECAERNEWENTVEQLMTEPAEPCDTGGEHDFSIDDYQLRFRLPNSSDLAQIGPGKEPRSAVTTVLERCVSHARYKGASRTVSDLPVQVVEALGRRIEELDPQAEISIQLTCPNCGHEWQVLFDIGRFLWAEISDWAERILLAVHELAEAYHWREADILALSPVRRQLYLGMVR